MPGTWIDTIERWREEAAQPQPLEDVHTFLPLDAGDLANHPSVQALVRAAVDQATADTRAAIVAELEAAAAATGPAPASDVPPASAGAPGGPTS